MRPVQQIQLGHCGIFHLSVRHPQIVHALTTVLWKLSVEMPVSPSSECFTNQAVDDGVERAVGLTHVLDLSESSG